MAKIAVYDKFYERRLDKDIVSEALKSTSHEVVAKAFRLRDAVRQILQFKDADPKERPDIFIFSGRLEAELEYKTKPETITEPCMIKRRTWYGTKEVKAQRTTFLLPRYKVGSNTYQFPSVTGEYPHLPHDVARQWEPIQVALAAPLLSRMVDTYLPEAIRLGVSDNRMYDSILHQSVLRYEEDAAHQMYDHVRHYGHIADMNHAR